MVGRPAVVGRPCCGGETPLWWGDPGGTLKVQKGRWARNGPFPFKTAFSWSTAQEQKFGTNLTISCRSGGEGDPAVVGKIRCGGLTPLWWGDPGSKRADGPETDCFL